MIKRNAARIQIYHYKIAGSDVNDDEETLLIGNSSKKKNISLCNLQG
jgi:hypothetical protein